MHTVIAFIYASTLVLHIHSLQNQEAINKMFPIIVPFINKPLVTDEGLLPMGGTCKYGAPLQRDTALAMLFICTIPFPFVTFRANTKSILIGYDIAFGKHCTLLERLGKTL